jgi:hypothetical protein
MVDAHDDAVPVVDLATPAVDRSRRGRAVIAAFAAIGLSAGALGVLAASGGEAPKPVPLALSGPAGGDARAADGSASGEPESSDLVYPGFEYRYTLGGALADLGDRAPVYRLLAGAMDTARVGAMAGALGIDAPVGEIEGGWEVSDGERTLMVSGDASGWYVSVWQGPGVTRDVEPGSGGVDGSGSGGGTDGDVGDDTSTAEEPTKEPVPDEQPVPEPIEEPVDLPDEPVDLPDEPVDLPDEHEARRIAEEVLGALGVLAGGDWVFEVHDGTMMGVAVACPEDGDCPTGSGDDAVLLSRSVTARRIVDGHPVVGLEWYVEVGDHGVVQWAGGMLADLERVADYPLRSTRDVYDDLTTGKAYGGPLPLGAEPAIADADCPPDARCTAPDCLDCPAPEPVEITVNAVSLAAQVWYALDEHGAPVSYIVPTYHFSGRFADGTDWSTDLLAVDEAYVAPPPVVEPQPDPDEVKPDPGGGGVVPPDTGAPDPGDPPDAENPTEFDPEADLAPGDAVAMDLDLNFHCGVSTVRFDARWWDATPPWPGSGGGSPIVEQTAGKLLVVDETHATWSNGAGVDLEFVEHPGEYIAPGCA